MNLKIIQQNQKRPKNRFLLYALLMLAASSVSALSKPAAVGHIRITLDTFSFPPDEYDRMQTVANQTAKIVDDLIPESRNETLICFVWPQINQFNRPITLLGPKDPAEPPSTVAGTVRIAVSAVLPDYQQRFAYQLAHELAHVKMNPHYDNFLLETFAVAVSLEVIRRLGPNFSGYYKLAVDDAVAKLPEQIRRQVAAGDDVELRAFWQSQSHSQHSLPWDYSPAIIGSLLLEHHHLTHWERLADIGSRTICHSEARPDPVFETCDADVTSMKRLRDELRALGYTKSQLRLKKLR